jgi:hypothetical protein
VNDDGISGAEQAVRDCRADIVAAAHQDADELLVLFHNHSISIYILMFLLTFTKVGKLQPGKKSHRFL